jgi:hypothetical protein
MFADRRGGSSKVYNSGSSRQETGSEEGTKQVSPLCVCVCCRHHDRLSKALLVSPHYDAGSTSLTVTHRSNSNSPAKWITKVPTRDFPIQSRSVNQFSVVFGRRLWWQLLYKWCLLRRGIHTVKRSVLSKCHILIRYTHICIPFATVIKIKHYLRRFSRH